MAETASIPALMSLVRLCACNQFAAGEAFGKAEAARIPLLGFGAPTGKCVGDDGMTAARSADKRR